MLAAALRRAARGRPVSLLHLPLSWDGGSWPFRHPLDYLGSDGGGGIGGGPGIAVGAALALRGTGPVAGGDLRRWRLPDGRRPRYGRRCIPHPAADRSWRTTSRSSMTRSTRSALPACAAGRSTTVDRELLSRSCRSSGPASARAQGPPGFGPVSRRGRAAPALPHAIAACRRRRRRRRRCAGASPATRRRWPARSRDPHHERSPPGRWGKRPFGQSVIIDRQHNPAGRRRERSSSFSDERTFTFKPASFCPNFRIEQRLASGTGLRPGSPVGSIPCLKQGPGLFAGLNSQAMSWKRRAASAILRRRLYGDRSTILRQALVAC